MPNKPLWGQVSIASSIISAILSVFFFLSIFAEASHYPFLYVALLVPTLFVTMLGRFALGFIGLVILGSLVSVILAWRQGGRKVVVVSLVILLFSTMLAFGAKPLKELDSPNWTSGWQTIDNSAYNFRYKVPPGGDDSRDYANLDSADLWDFGLGDLVVVVYEQPLNELCALKELPRWPGVRGGELDCTKTDEVEIPTGKKAITVLVPEEEESDGWMSAIEQTPEQTIIIWYHDWSLSDEQVRERNLKILRSFEFGD